MVLRRRNLIKFPRRTECYMFKHLRQESGFYRNLLRLSLPLVFQNLLANALNLFDIFMVGALGQTEMASVSLASTPVFIVTLIIFGMQSGSSVLISQYWGKRNMDAISRVMSLGLIFCAGLTAVFASACWLFSSQIMSVMTDNQELIFFGAKYLKIIGFASFLTSFTQMFAATQRSMENPRFGLYVLAASMATNTLLNYMLIFGKFGAPKLGVEGAAVATVLSRVVELIITVVFIAVNRGAGFHLRAMLRPGIVMLRDFIKYSIPVALNELIWSLGISIYPVIFGHMSGSADIISAYTITTNIERLTTVVTFGIAASTAVIIGKSIGSGKSREEVYSMGAALNIVSTLIGIASGAVMLALTRFVIMPLLFPVFSLTAAAIEICTGMLLICSFSVPFRAFNCTNIVGVWRGGGDVGTALVLDTVTLYLYSVPFAAILGLAVGAPVLYVYLVIVSEELLKMAPGILRFRSGKWVNDVTREALS